MTSPTPGPVAPSTSQSNVLLAFIQSLMKSFNVRQNFDVKTPQFWAALGSVAAIVVAWFNPSRDLSTAAQATVTAIGGLVVAVLTHASASKVPISQLQKMVASLSSEHQQLIAKTALNPSPAGQIGAVGGYSKGVATGSVLAPGAVIVVPGPGGTAGVSGTGGTTPGATNEGHVSGNVTINIQSGPYAAGTGAESNLPLGTAPGTNSNEGTGGPVISQRQGGLGTGGSVVAPGGYVPPAPNAPNPDEANPTIGVAKATPPHKRAPHKE